MADIEQVWKVEESAKRNRTVINPTIEKEDVCAAARSRIIALNAEISRLQAQINQK